jgi:hypothetical protein
MFSASDRTVSRLPAERRARLGGPHRLSTVLPNVVDELASLARAAAAAPERGRPEVIAVPALLSNAA